MDWVPRSRRWPAARPYRSTSTSSVDRRLPDSVEVAAYYVVAEALTNAAKHARASVVKVCVETDDANLHLSIRDDGIGGADAGKGSGLIGLIDRVEALGGTNVDLESRRKRDLAARHDPAQSPRRTAVYRGQRGAGQRDQPTRETGRRLRRV